MKVSRAGGPIRRGAAAQPHAGAGYAHLAARAGFTARCRRGSARALRCCGEQLAAGSLTGTGQAASVVVVTLERLPKGKAVRAPAAGLPPQSFGRYDSNWPTWIFLGVVIVALCTIVLAVRGFTLGFFVSVLIVCGAGAAAGGMLSPATWVTGGDGWLMLLRGRKCRAWIRTGRLVSVSLEFRRAGDNDVRPLLILRDDGGRELRTSLSALTPGAAASLLAGIGQSAEDSLADLGSPAAQAAVTALHELARAGTAEPG